MTKIKPNIAIHLSGGFYLSEAHGSGWEDLRKGQIETAAQMPISRITSCLFAFFP